MKKIKFKKWFDLNLGWLFINGRKQEDWQDYLKKEYVATHGSRGLTKIIYLIGYSLLMAIGVPLMIVAVFIATPPILLLILADEIDFQRKRLNGDDAGENS